MLLSCFRALPSQQPLTSRVKPSVSARQAQSQSASCVALGFGLAAVLGCLACSSTGASNPVESEVGRTLAQGETTVGGDVATANVGSGGSAGVGSMAADITGSAGTAIAGRAGAPGSVTDDSTSGSPAQQTGCTGPSEVGCSTCCIETSFGCAQLGSTEADAGAAIYDTRTPLDECPVDCQPCAACVGDGDAWIETTSGSEQYASCTCDGSSSLDPCFSPISCECACEGFYEFASCSAGD